MQLSKNDIKCAAKAMLGAVDDLLQIHWQPDCESGAFVSRTFNRNITLMVLNDLVTNRKAETGADAHTFGGEARIENFIKLVWRNTHAIIGYFDDHLVVFLKGGNCDVSFVFDGLFSVDKQVEVNLIQSAGKTCDWWDVAEVLV